MKTIGILPLGRPTFDVPFAEEKLTLMLAKLEASGHKIVGPRELLFDEEATRAAMSELKEADIDHLMILQVTFTDASMTVAAAMSFELPVSIWAVPEPRIGGRLRLNAFCGLNLASHALSLNDRSFSWAYMDPEKDIAEDIEALLSGAREVERKDAGPVDGAGMAEGQRIAEALRQRRIARIGERPVGFDTCNYDKDKIRDLTGVEVDELELNDLFDAARKVDPKVAAGLREQADAVLSGLDEVDQDELDKSLRLKAGLDDISKAGGYDAFALRCWPETFTEYGGAVCGPASMMGEGKTPCACEADVFGSLTQLMLQEACSAPVFLTDLVDMDADDDSGVIWHCGQAPISMKDPEEEPTATIHTNRKKPLLYQFPLKPGKVTMLRISQSYNQIKMVLGFGEMLRRPMSFTGTSGVVRFERPAGEVLETIMDSGLEHHMAIAYGDHREALRSVAAELGLPVLEI